MGLKRQPPMTREDLRRAQVDWERRHAATDPKIKRAFRRSAADADRLQAEVEEINRDLHG